MSTQINSSHLLTQIDQLNPFAKLSLSTLPKTSIKDEVAGASLTELLLDRLSRALISNHTLERFAQHIFAAPANTRRSYLTDVYGGLVIKFFYLWDYPKQYDPIAMTVYRLNQLLEFDRQHPLQSCSTQRKIELLDQVTKFFISDYELQPLTDKNSLFVKKKAVTTHHEQYTSTRTRIGFRSSLENSSMSADIKIAALDQKLLNLICSLHNEQMDHVFWAELFNMDKLDELRNFWLKNGNSENTVARKISSFRRFEKFLLNVDLLRSPVVSEIIRPRIRPTPQITLSSKQSDQMLIAVTEKLNGFSKKVFSLEAYLAHRNCAMLYLLDSTAIRATALSSIKLKDIDLVTGRLSVVEKGRKNLHLHIPQPTLRYLNQYSKVREQFVINHPLKRDAIDSFFLTKAGLPMNYRSLSRIVDEVAEQSGIKTGHLKGCTIGAHTIRRSVATQLRNNGAPIDDIKDMLGHSCSTTTEIYIRAATRDNRHTLKHYHPRAK